MKSTPMLFNADMVRAIISASKTQTRRVLKQQPPEWVSAYNGSDGNEHFLCEFSRDDDMMRHWPSYDEGIKCPYGKVSDQLWVRETWNHDCYPYPISDNPIFHYRADYFDDPLGADLELSKDGIRRKWFPSIHMPRKASRIQLEITNVRVERLNDISEADAYAEGAANWAAENRPLAPNGEPDKFNTCMQAYKALWESINGAGSWSVNPWVWVIEFEVLK